MPVWIMAPRVVVLRPLSSFKSGSTSSLLFIRSKKYLQADQGELLNQ